MSIYNQIIKNTIPKHIAIIMDGNGRWALEKGKKDLRDMFKELSQ